MNTIQFQENKNVHLQDLVLDEIYKSEMLSDYKCGRYICTSTCICIYVNMYICIHIHRTVCTNYVYMYISPQQSSDNPEITNYYYFNHVLSHRDWNQTSTLAKNSFLSKLHKLDILASHCKSLEDAYYLIKFFSTKKRRTNYNTSTTLSKPSSAQLQEVKITLEKEHPRYCSSCLKEDKNATGIIEWIQCDLCLLWIHLSCTIPS